MKNERKDTWGKPNLYERFRYHTKIGRFFYDFEDPTDRLIIVCVMVVPPVLFVIGMAGYLIFR